MFRKLVYLGLIVSFSLSVSAQTAADKYIENYREAAVSTMNQHGIPASIVLGIAIHESASGTSRIARYLNNHFGLKGNSGPKKIRSAYKGYESVDDCYDDFVAYLKRRFSSLFATHSPDDYQSWVKSIQRGGYAHSKTWGSQVMAIIKKYRLYELDNGQNNLARQTVIKPVPLAETSEPLVYHVKKGDTLLKIAKQFDTTVKEIKQKNGLTSSMLNIGQRLHL